MTEEHHKGEVPNFPGTSLPTPLPTPNAKLIISDTSLAAQDTAVPLDGYVDKDHVRGMHACFGVKLSHELL